ncbi:MAG: 16S rRNA (uracil(1498)-N(3))-methyltransferase [Rhodothermia bacterium]|nr:16S rRNA (uracil(1498)-N(3))-methyltransferase [Rhodothermia bacterium]
MPPTTFFFAPPESFSGDQVSLPADEAHHASRVLRLKAGAEIEVVDGRGGWHRVLLTHSDGGRVEGEIRERRLGVGEPGFDLELAIGVLKNRSRLETAIEKAVEIGVNEITLLQSSAVAEVRVDLERCERLARAAMKQSLRSVVPRLHEPRSFADFIESKLNEPGVVCDASDTAIPLPKVIAQSGSYDHCLILVGPEGGFTADELGLADDSGFARASLGSRRLRTETAAIVACGLAALALDRTQRTPTESA